MDAPSIERIGVGLEFGTSSVYTAAAERRSNGSRKLLLADETPLRGYSNGRIVDFDAAQQSVHEALLHAEEWTNAMIQRAHIAMNMTALNFDLSLIDNIARCFREIPMQIDGIAYPPCAIAEVALNRHQKTSGALVVDVSEGSTDCVMYVDGAVNEMVSVGLGWHHMSDNAAFAATIARVPAEILAGNEVEGNMPKREIQMGLREAFRILKWEIEVRGGCLQRLGGGIFVADCTGLLRGINELAEQVFELPAKRACVQGIAGPKQVLADPKYTCAIGLATLAEPSTETYARV